MRYMDSSLRAGVICRISYFGGKADKMKHGTYVKGVATGVILTVLAGGGIKAVQYCRSDEILSDLGFYTENKISGKYDR